MAIDINQLRASLGQLANGDGAVNNALQAGVDIGNQFFGAGSLGRANLPEGHTAAESTLLHDSMALAGQNPRLVEQQQALQGLSRIAGNAEYSSPDVQQALDASRSRLNGLTAQETQLLTEQGNTGIDSSLATALRAAQVGNLGAGRLGAGGGISAAPAIAQAIAASQQNQRDIGQFNIGLRDSRLNQFSELARGIETDRFNRMLQSAGAYTDATRLQRNADYTNALAARGQAAGINQGIQQRQAATNAFNLNQIAAEKSGQIGSIFGAGEFGAAQQGRRESFEIGKEQVRAAGGQAPTINYIAAPGGSSTGRESGSFSGGDNF